MATQISLATDSTPQNPAMVVHLLDYLAKDYGGAVKDGKIISESEYGEQLQFAEIVERSVQNLPAFQSDVEFGKEISKFTNKIKSKASADEVSLLARKLQADAIKLAKIQVSPTHWPDMSMGAEIYGKYCTACHGKSGNGNGPAGKGLDPAPANFIDRDTTLASSPYQYFNTIRLGVPGTGMVAFSNLSDEEVWEAAFYVKSLGHTNNMGDSGGIPLELDQVAAMTDTQIIAAMEGDQTRKSALLAAIRTYQPRFGTNHFLAIAGALLNRSQEKYRSGQYNDAVELSLKAYLEGIEPLEPKIKANKPELVVKIERVLAEYRALLSENSSQDIIDSKYKQVQETITAIQASLVETKMSPSVAFGAAFSIFLREGFEAVLIIIVLLSVIKAMGALHATKWVHFGWLLAVGIGFLTWFASGAILNISGYSRELLEAMISLFAVIVLLYVGFWLHKHSEIKKWQEFLRTKVESALDNKKLVGLMLVSFIAVFREAFEVVLFLRAIWFDLDRTGKSYASFGVLLSFALIIGLSYLMVRSSKRLPISLLFKICSVTMAILALILVGKGIHSFQEAGTISVNLLPVNLRADVIGLYPTWETIISQAAIVGIILFMRAKTRSSETVMA